MIAGDASGRNKRRTGHFMAHLGVPSEIHVRAPLQGKDLAILEFSPRQNLPVRTFATNGMSEHVQLLDGRATRTELILVVADSQPWTVELLDALARYPLAHQTRLLEHDTMALDEGVIEKVRPFVGLLIASPARTFKPTLGGISDPELGCIPVHQVVGITGRELDFAIANGGHELWNRLRPLATDFCWDRPRTEVV